MLYDSYEMWGVTIAAILMGVWTVRALFRRKMAEHGKRAKVDVRDCPPRDHDIEHRALMFLMAQKTDSVLAALTRTIEQERQKLGGVVRKPSMNEALDVLQEEAMPASAVRFTPYERILPMVHDGITVAKIARQLKLPEAEVSMVKRLNAA